MADPSPSPPPDPGARPHRARGPTGRAVLVGLGLAFLVVAFSADAFAFVDGQLGFDRLAAAALGLLFLYVAWVASTMGRVRESLLDRLEEVLEVFYGPSFRRERQAIDILVQALESADESVRTSARGHLMRLTGQDFGDDAGAWAGWWANHRSTFRAPPRQSTNTGSGHESA